MHIDGLLNIFIHMPARGAVTAFAYFLQTPALAQWLYQKTVVLVKIFEILSGFEAFWSNFSGSWSHEN